MNWIISSTVGIYLQRVYFSELLSVGVYLVIGLGLFTDLRAASVTETKKNMCLARTTLTAC